MIASSIGASVSLVGPGTGGSPVFSVETALVREPGQHYRGIPHGVLPCPPPCNSCWTRSRSRSSPSSRSEEHTSELQSLMRTSYAVLRQQKKNNLQPSKHYPQHLPSHTPPHP